MKSTSVSCGSNSRGLFIGVPREEERDRVVEKYLKKQWPKFPKSGEKHQFTDLRNSVNGNQDKVKENHAQTHHNKTTKYQEKVFKSFERD